MTDRASFTERRGVRKHVRCGGKINMATAARRRNGLNRINRALRVHHCMETEGQIRLAGIDVAKGTVARVFGMATRVEWREKGAAEVIDAAVAPDHDVSAAELLHVDAVMNPMHQKVEIDALGRFVPFSGVRRVRALRYVGVGIVVTEDAVLRIVAQ